MDAETRREFNYQLLKLAHSGRSLREAMAEARVIMFGFRKNTLSTPKEYKDLVSLEAGWHRLTQTRQTAKTLAKEKFFPRKNYGKSQEQAITKFVTGMPGNIRTERDGNLIRRGPPNKPRPGTYKGKAELRVQGATQTLKEFKALINQLKKLTTTRKQADSLKKAYKGLAFTIKQKTGG